MKPSRVILVSAVFTGFLSGCGGVTTSSESHGQSSSSDTSATTPVNSTTTETTEVIFTTEESTQEVVAVAAVEEETIEPEASTDALADIDVVDAANVAKAATQLAKQSLVSNEISATSALASFKSGDSISSHSKGQFSIGQLLLEHLPVAATVIENTEPTQLTGSCGGVAVTESNMTYDDSVGFPYEVEASVVFEEFCSRLEDYYSGGLAEELTGYDITFNGAGDMRSRFPSAAEGHYEFSFNFLIQTDFTFMPPTVALKQGVSCSYFNGIENFDPNGDCAFTINFETDNHTYTASDYLVTGDNTVGYDVEITVTSDSNDSYNASFSGLKVCDNGNFGSGTGSLLYHDKEFSITYTSCNEAVVAYETLRYTIQQSCLLITLFNSLY